MFRNMTTKEANIKVSFCGAAGPALLAAVARLAGTVLQDVGECGPHPDPEHKGLLVVGFSPQGVQIRGFTPRFQCYALAPGVERIPMLLAGADGVAFVRSPGSDERDVLAALKAGLPSSKVMPGAPLMVVDFQAGPQADRSALDAMRTIAQGTLKVIQQRWTAS
jgi:hypothetical protein